MAHSRLSQIYSRLVAQWGWDPRRSLRAIAGFPRSLREQRDLRAQWAQSSYGDKFERGRAFRITSDYYGEAAQLDRQYFYQDLIVAREVYDRNPRRHLDVGSSIAGLVSHLAVFRRIQVLDVRPLSIQDRNIEFIQADLMSSTLSEIGLFDSISCLHVLEHLGLGRYGDKVNFEGWRQGLDKLTGLLEDGGRLYLSVPTGSVQRLEFNAHRVFRMPFLLDEFRDAFSVDRVDVVTDEGLLVEDVDTSSRFFGDSGGMHYGCSIWSLTRRV